MLGIKLPGSKQVKKIALIVLVIFATCILIKEGINNNINNEQIDTKSTDTIKSETSNLDDRANNNSSVSVQREDELYQDAFQSFHSKDYSSAISSADKVINEFPNSYKGYSIRGIAKAYNGSFEDGMADIDKALQINPNYGYGRFNKALNYELYGHYDDALNWYDKALEIEQYLWSYYGKASIYGRYGDVSNSVDNLKKALQIAEGEGSKQSVIEEARNEKDFDNVKDSEEFQNLLN